MWDSVSNFHVCLLVGGDSGVSDVRRVCIHELFVGVRIGRCSRFCSFVLCVENEGV